MWAPVRIKKTRRQNRESGLAFRAAMRFAAPRCRADADHRGKHPRKMALIGKARRYRNLGQRQAADGHQLLRRLDALAQQPLVRRQAGGGAKRAREMADRKTKL